MLNNSLNRKGDTSFRNFIAEIKGGVRNFLQVLNTSEHHFSEATFEQLLSNESDVLAGVNRVQKNFSQIYFELFDSCLIKHHDNGDVKFIFYTTTRQLEKIIHVSSILFEEFGNGIFDSSRFTPFTDHEKIKRLSQSVLFSGKDEIVHYWSHEDLSMVLQYKSFPLHEFSLMITINHPKGIDFSIRRRGTILDLLQLDINELFLSEEVESRKKVEEGQIKFVDYLFQLKEKQFGILDSALIRIFDDKKYFRKNVQTHLTLFSSKDVSVDDIIAITEDLVKIYGTDNSCYDEIQMYERDILEEKRNWTGRNWNFNESHGLWNISNENEKLSYSVTVDYDKEEGFKLFIMAYNQLEDLFGLN
jgi:hypothetical protein